MRKLWIAVFTSAMALANAQAADAIPPGAKTVLNVWPGVAPGSEGWKQKEKQSEFAFAGKKVKVTRNVVTPTLTVYLPEPSKATGAGAIISPGGAFRHVTMDIEGYDVARWLASRGIAGFVLKYRVMETPVDDTAYQAALDALVKNLSRDGERVNRDDQSAPAIADGIQALKLVRAHAKEWLVDPDRVGMIGFSAGAALTSGVLLKSDAPKLAFAAPIYGAPFGAIPALPAKLPPVFLAVAQDDLLVRAAVLRFDAALQAAKHDSEVHIFSSGGHGFGMTTQGTTSDHWIDELHWWLQAKRIISK
jgi:acetyl esterase/lipase